MPRGALIDIDDMAPRVMSLNALGGLVRAKIRRPRSGEIQAPL